MRKSGRKGSVGELSIDINENFTIQELVYVGSWRDKIENLYNILRKIHYRANSSPNDSYTKFASKNKIDTRLMRIMKEYGYCNEKSEWKLESSPSYADAIFLQLKIRNYYQKAKSN
jgi:hypothetical protein